MSGRVASGGSGDMDGNGIEPSHNRSQSTHGFCMTASVSQSRPPCPLIPYTQVSIIHSPPIPTRRRDALITARHTCSSLIPHDPAQPRPPVSLHAKEPSGLQLPRRSTRLTLLNRHPRCFLHRLPNAPPHLGRTFCPPQPPQDQPRTAPRNPTRTHRGTASP